MTQQDVNQRLENFNDEKLRTEQKRTEMIRKISQADQNEIRELYHLVKNANKHYHFRELLKWIVDGVEE